MKKIVVATRDEAVKLISEGVNSMLVFSPEAPHGYKKDGTPAAPRGRKPLDEAVKKAREAKKAESGRPKTGPLVRTAEAPFGVKKDGTPMKKRGRPTKEVAAAHKAVAAALRAARVAEAQARKAERKAHREAVMAGMSPTTPEVVEVAPAVEAVVAPVTEVTQVQVLEQPELTSAVMENTLITDGTTVKLIEAVCVGEMTRSMTGKVSRVEGDFAYVLWEDGGADYRSLKVLQLA